MLLLQQSQKKNHFNFFYFGCATQNKALDMMELVSKIFFFIKQFMVEVSRDLITAQISRRFRPLLPEIFSKKSENSCKSFFCAHP